MTVHDLSTGPEPVELLDPDTQAAWKPVAEAGAGELAGQYVLATVLTGLDRAGIAARLSAERWTPLADLLPEGANPVLLRNTLRYLQIREIVESREITWDDAELSPLTPDGGSWRLTGTGAALLSQVGISLIGFYVDAYGPVLRDLDGLLRGTREYGVDVLRDHEALGRRCEPITISFMSHLLRRILDERGTTAVLELGSGTGGLLLDLVAADSRLRAVGLDIAPDAVALAAARVSEHGLEDRLSFVTGDAFAPATWPAGAASCDLFLAVGAVHESFRDGRAAVVELLSRYRDLLAAAPGRVLLLAEPDLQIDAQDADYYLAHVLTKQGFPQPRVSWLSVIADAGLTCERVYTQPNVGFRFAFYEITAVGAA